MGGGTCTITLLPETTSQRFPPGREPRGASGDIERHNPRGTTVNSSTHSSGIDEFIRGGV